MALAEKISRIIEFPNILDLTIAEIREIAAKIIGLILIK